jgi:hypothetical protein
LSSKLFLKYKFKARKFCVNFSLKATKRNCKKMQNFSPIWPNFFLTFADSPVWDLATVVQTSVANSWRKFYARSTEKFSLWRKSSAPHKIYTKRLILLVFSKIHKAKNGREK